MCEAKVAREAVENQNLAELFDKMCMSEVVPAHLSFEGATRDESIEKKGQHNGMPFLQNYMQLKVRMQRLRSFSLFAWWRH